MSAALDRRSALLMMSGLAAAGLGMSRGSGASESPAEARRRPVTTNAFLWGSAGAAYQIEGGNHASDLWVMEHAEPSIFKEPSGDAADTYNRVEEDIALAASLGFSTHRFSIEWSRIEPEPGFVSHANLAYYRRVLEVIRSHGMLPFVTYNHFTTPRWFAAAGGFETRDGIEPFVRFCNLVTEHLGDLIGLAATFNEPNLQALVSWSPAVRAMRSHLRAARQATAAEVESARWAPPMLGNFRVQQPIMIEAHNRAFDAIKKASAGAFPVGVTLALNDDRPHGTGAGVERKRFEVLLPWLEARGDFIGVQNYTYSYVSEDSDLAPESGVELTQMDYPFAPEALEGVIRTVAQHTSRPIYVTENGVATEDDSRRVAFIDRAVAGVIECLRDGIDVRGYLHWSLLDNWEWFSGYGPKFGLVSVDRQTFARSPKPSAHHFGRIARAGLPSGLDQR